MTSKTMKLLKECDCCQKKSGPTAQCSALFALKAMARGAGSTAPSLLGTDQQESEFCILHRSPLSSGQSDCIWDQPIVLHETVSPHLCLAVFFCPGVNKGLSPSPECTVRSHSGTLSAASELKLLLPDSSSSAHREVTKRSNFGMTKLGSLFRSAYLRFLNTWAWHVSPMK